MSKSWCRATCVMIVWLVCVSLVQADAIKDELDRARKQHQEAVDKAGTALLAAFDDQIKNLAATGNIDAVKVIIDEKEAFKATKTRPASSFMKEARARYDQAVNSAHHGS